MIALLALIKLPIAGLLLWMPFRADTPVGESDDSSSQDDGGTKTLPGGRSDGRRHPRGPLPRAPRRGPHGTVPPPPPERARPVRARGRRVSDPSHY